MGCLDIGDGGCGRGRFALLCFACCAGWATSWDWELELAWPELVFTIPSLAFLLADTECGGGPLVIVDRVCGIGIYLTRFGGVGFLKLRLGVFGRGGLRVEKTMYAIMRHRFGVRGLRH